MRMVCYKSTGSFQHPANISGLLIEMYFLCKERMEI